MKLTVTQAYEVSYAVRSFDSQGDYREDTYQDKIDDLAAALAVLDQANNARKSETWVLVVDVVRSVNGKAVSEDGRVIQTPKK